MFSASDGVSLCVCINPKSKTRWGGGGEGDEGPEGRRGAQGSKGQGEEKTHEMEAVAARV